VGGDRVSKVSRNTQVNELETWYGVTADDHLARDLTIPVVTGAVTLVVVGGDRAGTGKEGERMSKMKMHCVIHNAERAVEEAPDACWEFDGVDDCLFLDPADVVELARSLPGAEERVRPNGQRILVIELEPAPEHEPMIPGDVEWALPEEHQ
jgi:hypothetical protein